MKPPRTPLYLLVLCISVLFISNRSFAQTTFVPFGATWKYLDNGSDQGVAWRASSFPAEASWSQGPAELGYGDNPVTTVNYGPDPNNKYITTYFRHTVAIPNPSSFINFTLSVRRDDGIVVYINGTERYRNNMPAATLYTTLASGAAADDGDGIQTAILPSSVFVNGNNVIAVEIHQNTASSSDLTFDLQLVGNAPPVGIIAYGDSWKYLANNTRPTGWEGAGFDDTAWPSGLSELGYGDGDEMTCIPSSAAPASCTPSGTKFITSYFRKSFNVTNLANFSGFVLNVVRDDGVVIYINGTEVARNNMPGGLIAHSTLASTSIADAGETTPVEFAITACNLVEGVNTIAVEIHQNDATSSDISFNLELIGNIGGGTPSLARGPYLQMGSETAMTFRWRTSAPSYGRVRVGSAQNNYTIASASESCATTEHIVRVTGLSPDTKYFYEIGMVDGTVLQAGADNFFQTSPPANSTRKIRIAAFGDCGRGDADYQDQTLANYRSKLATWGVDAADAWILMGDNAYNSGTDLEYTTKFFNIYGPNLLKNHKLFPSPGNHDYGNNGSNKTSRSMPYHTIFSVPSNGESGGVGSQRPNYYSYNVGNIHFLSLDSWGIETDDANKDMGSVGTSRLKTWITNDLAANTSKWIVAYWHHPPYTKSSHDSDDEIGDPELPRIRENFIGFLESKGVDLIICGHSHAYERGYLVRGYTQEWPNFNIATTPVSNSSGKYINAASCPYVYNSTPLNHGTVYVVAGSAGASGGTHTGFNSPTGPMPFSINDGGVFYFETEGNRLDAKMIQRTGDIFDQFTIMKDVNQSTTYNVITGSTITLNASWPGTYTWSNTASTTRSVSFTPAVSGTTNINVTDQFGCVTDHFTINATGVLPISLIRFDVQFSSNNQVNVTWSTAHEIDNHHFTIERSTNGRDFTVVGTVGAGLYPNSIQNYSFTDASPMPGTSYYRLSQTDHDGRVVSLGIRRLANAQAKSFDAKTFSSSNQKLVVEINSQFASTCQLRIFDMNGRERRNERLQIAPGSVYKEFSLAAGTYIWEVRQDKGETIIQKIIIQ